MSVAVLVRAHVQPERVDTLIAALRERMESDGGSQRGRLRERVFQRIGSPGEFLSLSQWTALGSDTGPTACTDLIRAASVEPPATRRLTRLLTFERPLQRTEVTACAIIVPTRGDSSTVRERVVQDRRELRDAPGLISHEIYVTTERPTLYLSVHSWRRLTDLQRFRDEAGALNETRLAEVGATLERFTGALVAEYPLTVVKR